jgi:hypothetical protein
MPKAEAEAILSSQPRSYVLRDTADRILQLVRARPGSTASRLARHAAVSSNTVRKVLSEQVAAGEVRPAGSGQGDDRAGYHSR